MEHGYRKFAIAALVALYGRSGGKEHLKTVWDWLAGSEFAIGLPLSGMQGDQPGDWFTLATFAAFWWFKESGSARSMTITEKIKATLRELASRRDPTTPEKTEREEPKT